MISFLFPGLFVALAGLVIPLLIHLWNRKKSRVIKVGSIQLIKETSHPNIRNIEFTEFWLFLLRAVILILFTLLLTRPVWKQSPKANPTNKWVLIDPRIPDYSPILSQWDQNEEQNIEVRYFDQGFPANRQIQDPEMEYTLSAWSLLNELALSPLRPDSLIVYSYSLLRDIHGKRPELPFSVKWITLPIKSSSTTVLEAVRKEEHLHLLLSHSNDSSLIFRTFLLSFPQRSYTLTLDSLNEIGLEYLASKNLLISDQAPKDTIPVRLPDTVTFQLYTNETSETDHLYIQSAIEVLNEYLPHHIDFSQPKEIQQMDWNSDWICWLSDDTIPSSPGFTGNLIIYQEEKHSSSLIIPHKIRPDTYLLTQHISAVTKDAGFLALPGIFMELIWKGKFQTLTNTVTDLRQLPVNQILPVQKKYKSLNLQSITIAKTELYLYLWGVLCFCVLVERIISINTKNKP